MKWEEHVARMGEKRNEYRGGNMDWAYLTRLKASSWLL
jgi:hypothetical protein